MKNLIPLSLVLMLASCSNDPISQGKDKAECEKGGFSYFINDFGYVMCSKKEQEPTEYQKKSMELCLSKGYTWHKEPWNGSIECRTEVK